MYGLHTALGWLVVVVNTIAGIWGISPLAGASTGRAGNALRHLIALGQSLVVAVALTGLMLLADRNAHVSDPLHTRVYGLFMGFAIVAAWGFRTDDARQNARVFGVAALIIAALGIRALQTA